MPPSDRKQALDAGRKPVHAARGRNAHVTDIFSLHDRAALVTGASRGLGPGAGTRALAEAPC
jgi:hypothetical protein